MLLLQGVIALKRIFADEEFCMFCSFQNLNFGVWKTDAQVKQVESMKPA